MPKRRVLAFGEYGGVASAICNNLVAYLLFLRKCHAPAQSLLRLGPRSWVFAPAFLKSKLANAAVCPVRTAFGPWRVDQKTYPREMHAITFLTPRTTPRGFFAILTTHRRNFFSALEGLLSFETRSFAGANRA
jgi:hypothetical protein